MITERIPPVDLPAAPAIPGLRFRRPRTDDADYLSMATLISAANMADGIPYAPTASNLREEWESHPPFDPSTDVLLAEVDGRLVAVAGSERVVRDGVVVFELWGHVDPTWRRRGLGRTLLAENLRRAAERGRAEPPGTTTEARAYASDTETGHRRLLAHAGFEVVRWYFEMRRPDLEGIPEIPLPNGIETHPVRPEEHRAIYDADIEAFRDHWGAREPRDEDFAAIFAKEDLDTSLWVVGWDGDQVAGSVQSWIYRGENVQLGVARGWLEHISVRRPWRRRGLAAAMTAEALRRLRAAGMTEAMLGVDAENESGALGLYERLGFEVHHRTTAFRRAL